MADYILSQDLRAIAIASAGNHTPEQETATDWLTAVTTTAATKWDTKYVDADATEVRIWDGNTTYYKMRGMDQLTNGLYATWVVSGTPDFAAIRYVGPLLGPLRDVCVVDIWTS